MYSGGIRTTCQLRQPPLGREENPKEHTYSEKELTGKVTERPRTALPRTGMTRCTGENATARTLATLPRQPPERVLFPRTEASSLPAGVSASQLPPHIQMWARGRSSPVELGRKRCWSLLDVLLPSSSPPWTQRAQGSRRWRSRKTEGAGDLDLSWDGKLPATRAIAARVHGCQVPLCDRLM